MICCNDYTLYVNSDRWAALVAMPRPRRLDSCSEFLRGAGRRGGCARTMEQRFRQSASADRPRVEVGIARTHVCTHNTHTHARTHKHTHTHTHAHTHAHTHTPDDGDPRRLRRCPARTGARRQVQRALVSYSGNRVSQRPHFCAKMQALAALMRRRHGAPAGRATRRHARGNGPAHAVGERGRTAAGLAGPEMATVSAPASPGGPALSTVISRLWRIKR